MPNRLKQNGLSIGLILLSLVILSISGLAYYQSTRYTAKKYDQKLIKDRNEIITQVDRLTGALIVETDVDASEDEIQTLTKLTEDFKTKVDNTKIPKGCDLLKQSNIDFADKSEAVITKAAAYLAATEDDKQDVTTVIKEYNTSVENLNIQVKTIADEVKER